MGDDTPVYYRLMQEWIQDAFNAAFAEIVAFNYPNRAREEFE